MARYHTVLEKKEQEHVIKVAAIAKARQALEAALAGNDGSAKLLDDAIDGAHGLDTAMLNQLRAARQHLQVPYLLCFVDMC